MRTANSVSRQPGSSQMLAAIKKFKENTHDNEVVKKTTMREMKMLSMLEYENLDILKDALKR